jgi:FO synthase
MTQLTEQEALGLIECDAASLTRRAKALRDQGKGQIISYSPKVFIPLTQLCRDACGYCTFATTPKNLEHAYLTRDQVLKIASAGAAAGCHEALFTLGDKPELRYAAAREQLEALGHTTTVSYLAEMAELVLNESGLLPHINAGVMDAEDMMRLRNVSFSQGLMLESVSERLCAQGGPHFGSPDKHPAARLKMIDAAGELSIPFTTGILSGIGEIRRERVESLLAIRESHRRYGHIQEVIVQNFRAKPNTRMARAPEPELDDIVWTVAAARLIFGGLMNIQVPPNLNRGALAQLIDAGINDWGGISPITRDYVNPEAAWPHIAELRKDTACSGKTLVERLTIYPEFSLDVERWVAPTLQARVRMAIDSEGYARNDAWSPGTQMPIPKFEMAIPKLVAVQTDQFGRVLDRAAAGEDLCEEDIVSLLTARGDRFAAVCAAADDIRKRVNGDVVSYVVVRNINYTNVCYYHCKFCAFSKGKRHEHLRGSAYVLKLSEIVRRAKEAWNRGATEVCLQGGIHPEYTGDTYVEICRAIKEAVPEMHIHAFSPLEVWQGAATLGIPVSDFLSRLRDAGLGTLPGTAAEILDDEVRRVLCPDKLTTEQWFSVIEAAHQLGFKTTATIMFGHIERPVHVARHLRRLRDLQRRTGGFTEFVPLPFVPMESPIYLRGKARRGPTFREAILVHAVGRLALHPFFKNIQTSWAKMGNAGAAACLSAGCNDFGGTLMNESISKAAGGENGQELPPKAMEKLIRSQKRVPRQRTTLYARAATERVTVSMKAAPLTPIATSGPTKGVFRKLSEPEAMTTFGTLQTSSEPEAPL